ncbi:MAG: YggT family protein [Nostocoides sp.]
MTAIGQIIDTILLIYLIILIARLVFDWVQVFAREWRPHGVVLVIAEGVYSLTDPPLRALRSVIPPLRIGGVALDLAFFVLVIGVQVIRLLVASIL